MQRKNSFIVLVAILAIIHIIYILIPEKDRTVLNYISLASSLLSIYGLILAYLQILSLKEVSRETQRAVIASSNRLQKVLSVSELSKSKKLIEEIQQYIHVDNYSGALIRLKDLKEILIQTKYINDLTRFTTTKTYRDVITTTGIDTTTISDSLLKNTLDRIDKGLITSNLEKTKMKLIEFESELKYRNHDK